MYDVHTRTFRTCVHTLIMQDFKCKTPTFYTAHEKEDMWSNNSKLTVTNTILLFNFLCLSQNSLSS